MNKKAILLVIVVLTSMIFISGCVQQPAIRTAEEAGKAVSNVSNDVDNVAEVLGNIDRTLGGG